MHMPCACHAHAVRVPCAHHTYGPLCACPTHALYRKTRACPTPVPDSIFGKANAGYDPVGLDQSDNSVGLEMEPLEKDGEQDSGEGQDSGEIINGFKVAPTQELMEGGTRGNGFARA